MLFKWLQNSWIFVNKSQDKLNKELYNAARNEDKGKQKVYFKRTNIIHYHFRITNLLLISRGYLVKRLNKITESRNIAISKKGAILCKIIMWNRKENISD